MGDIYDQAGPQQQHTCWACNATRGICGAHIPCICSWICVLFLLFLPVLYTTYTRVTLRRSTESLVAPPPFLYHDEDINDCSSQARLYRSRYEQTPDTVANSTAFVNVTGLALSRCNYCCIFSRYSCLVDFSFSSRACTGNGWEWLFRVLPRWGGEDIFHNFYR